MTTPALSDDAFDSYLEAGRIASRIRNAGAGLIHPGAAILEIVETVEQMVIDSGAGLAFPLNFSLNEDAAHDTASVRDERLLAVDDVVKLDLGVHLDGYIADTAVTVDLGDHPLLIEASSRALDAAITMVRPGATIGQISSAIQQEIEGRGFRPVANLTGHGLARYQIHTPPTIPNLSFQDGVTLEEGMVFAIEPFASTGSGRVTEKQRVEIFQQISTKPVRLPAARRILGVIRERRGMPFARRWIPGERQDIALSSLLTHGLVRAYPVLADVPGCVVSQHEHTLIVTANGCIVTTA
ncbi:MAG TPA: type II methionyl aminopeptidase [Methanoregulaceae archaeon]|nr:MAG: type II methionyl aminopeptidase [Methanolinea sp.]HON81566.1 type II methionyl aminopeptidase [Methanoregulaceae archaeon]HPD10373.1 type II methionyl aminopeptidase [Methanoregulaceae archaeon]HRT15315.1 type II methionyl aminopeptidase [Methanoregulaceae archaeon]HRU30965.1 type II methionyl aminopeptidase [Methanoregulaceae archaeon]